jgi:hypothetical protein
VEAAAFLRKRARFNGEWNAIDGESKPVPENLRGVHNLTKYDRLLTIGHDFCIVRTGCHAILMKQDCHPNESAAGIIFPKESENQQDHWPGAIQGKGVVPIGQVRLRVATFLALC